MLGHGNHREAMVSRRKYLLLSGSLASGGLAGCIGTADAQTDVQMGELNVDGDTATVNNAPSEIAIEVSGEYKIESNSTPEQIKLTLQCHVGEESLVDDISTSTQFDTKAGTYEITGDLLDHRDVTADQLTPEAGKTLTVPLLVRIIISVVQNGEIVSESFVENQAPLEITAEGIEAMIGGTGSVTVVA